MANDRPYVRAQDVKRRTAVEIELFASFAIRQREMETPDGQVMYWWDIGQTLSDGSIVWSKDISGKSRDQAIEEGRRVFG